LQARAAGGFDAVHGAFRCILDRLREQFCEGANLADCNCAAAQSDGLYTQSGRNTWIGAVNLDGYVIEVDFTLHSGVLSGAGVRIDWERVGGQYYTPIRLQDMHLSGPSGSVQRASAVFRKPQNFTGNFTKHDLYLFANYNGHGWARKAKNIEFHRCFVRPATPEELGTGILADTLNGEITDIKALDVNGNTAFGKLLNQLDVDAGGTSAVVNEHASAVADLDGFASAYAGVTVQTNGGRIAGFRATSFVNPDGSGSGVLELLGDVVAPGTLSTNALTVGLGQNLLSNTDFSDSLNGWVTYKTGGGGNVNLYRRPPGSWAGKYYPTLACHQNSNKTDGYTDIRCHPKLVNGVHSKGAPVEAGEWIEVSVKASSHRCRFELRIHFVNKDGNHAGWSNILGSANDVRSSSTNPDLWPTYWGKWKAPAGTAYATIHIRKLATRAGSNDSWLFVHKPQLARSHANATQPAPYSPGGTTLITGDKVATGSVNADRMNTASFAATGLALFGGAVRSTNFVSGTRGWRIDNNGSMELQNLVARDWVQVGAVSEGVTYTNASSRAVNNGQDVTVATLGRFALGQFWQIAIRTRWRNRRKFRRLVWNGSDESYVYENAVEQTRWHVGIRYRSGSWGPWQNQHSSRWSDSTSWLEGDVVIAKQGVYDDVQVRMRVETRIRGGGSGSDAYFNNFDDVSVVARALVR